MARKVTKVFRRWRRRAARWAVDVVVVVVLLVGLATRVFPWPTVIVAAVLVAGRFVEVALVRRGVRPRPVAPVGVGRDADHDPLWPSWPQPQLRGDILAGWPTHDPDDAPLLEVFTREVSRRPSYMYKLAESKRRHRMVSTLGARYEPFRYNVKAVAYDLASRSGIAVPERYGPIIAFDDVDFSALADRVVIKATHGSTNRGIFLLTRRGEDRFFDLLDSKEKTSAMIRDEYHAFREHQQVSPKVIIEELLAPRADIADVVSIPDDLKLYCFYGRVVMVMQRRLNGTSDRSRWTFRFWTEDWQDLGAVKYRDRLDGDLPAPSGGAAVVEAARHLSRELAIPFARLDFFDTDRGPVLGEITPHPGPPEVLRADVDELLGREWELAEARFLADGRSLAYRRTN